MANKGFKAIGYRERDNKRFTVYYNPLSRIWLTKHKNSSATQFKYYKSATLLIADKAFKIDYI